MTLHATWSNATPNCTRDSKIWVKEKSTWAKPRARVAKLRQTFDARQILANWAGVDLTRINGLGLAVATKILTEIGPT